MNRSPIVAAAATKLALLALLALGSTACAHALGGPFDQSESELGIGVGGSGGGALTTTVTSTTGAGLGGASATSSSSTGDTHTSTSTSPGGVDTCDASLDCGSCGNCAIGNDCAEQSNACMLSAACSALIDCLQPCQDQTCADACASQNPDGQQVYISMVACVLCVACPNSCQGSTSGACGP